MKKLSLIHLGIGNVGKEVVSQIEKQKEKIKKDFDISLDYIGKFTSKNSNKEIEDSIKKAELPFVLIDTTSSDKTSPYIIKALQLGGCVVLANKRPLAEKFENFLKIYKFGSRKIFHETTVGAGLPVIETIRQLTSTGDEIVSVKGCFSGTLGFICSELEKGIEFSQAVKSAKEKGFTEFDPREDLSGQDVARKVLILARMMNQKIEPGQVKVEPLYPKSLSDCSVDEFMERVRELDVEFEQKMSAAKKKNKTLKFVAEVSKIGCFAKLVEVDKESPIGSLQGPDNIIVLQTKRYFERPMVIQGPGAGIEVTAAGVFVDILRAGGIL